jgi:hypothetical protein
MSGKLPRRVDKLQPGKLYPLRILTLLLPSSRGGRKLHLATVHRWRAEGKFSARKIGGCWYVSGAEVRRLLAPDIPPEVPRVLQPRRGRSSYEEALRFLQAEGLDVGPTSQKE